MNSRLSLKIILAIAIFGVLFSGTLTYKELFGQNALSCPAFGTPGTILGYPACVYGFFMFIMLAAVAALGLYKKDILKSK